MPRQTFRFATLPAFGSLVLGVLLLGAGQATAFAQEPKPDTYTVRPGDTLWALAQRFMGDPFLWPEIYRLNTNVVEDPHWIYPGEVLRLVGSANVASVPTTDTPIPTDSTAVSDTVQAPVVAAEPEAADSGEPLFPRAGANRFASTLRGADQAPYRPLRPGEFYASGFLTEGRSLPFGKLLGYAMPSQIGSGPLKPSILLYSEVVVQPPAGATYQVGDSLIALTDNLSIPDHGKIVAPTGLLRITRQVDGGYVAVVEGVYGRMMTGQAVLPAERFTPAGAVRPVAVADGIQASVLGGQEPQTLKGPMDVLFLDKGRQDGVAPGDIFEIRRVGTVRGDGTVDVAATMATVQVVRVGDHSATVRILSVDSPNIPAGTSARQVAKLPS